MYRILAFLKKKKEAKTITEISEEADIPYKAVRDNIYKLLALGAIETRDGKCIITEKGKQMLDEFIKEIERLKEMVNA
ncbi:MAG: winged helix-turn-helix domain-containing protein [Sulfolobaceae archaeon]